MLALALVVSVLLAGCTSQSGDKNSSSPSGLSTQGVHQDNEKSKDSISNSSFKESVKSSGFEETAAGDSYYNIRIVPASVLENLQKEMGPNDFLIHNEKGYAIGMVSSKGLVLRGDLVQLEQGLGNSGKDFDKTDVSLHLLDITFGLDNSKITLFKSDKKYKFWFDAGYTNSVVKYTQDLYTQLNQISGTTQFEDKEVSLGFLQSNYDVIPNNYYNIRIITDKMLQKFFDDRKDTDHLMKDKKGVLIGIVNQDYLYLLNTLTEEDQKYYILKGLLYSMGFHGTSYKNKESFFYREEGMNRNLSDLDIESIKLLYGGGIKTGGTLEDVRKTLGLST